MNRQCSFHDYEIIHVFEKKSNDRLLSIRVTYGGRISFIRSSTINLGHIGKIHSIVPADVKFMPWIPDACIAFAPNLFDSCKSMNIVKKEAANIYMLDFNLGEKNIPGHWNTLRYEAISTLNGLRIARSNLMYKDSLHPWEKEFFGVEKS